MHVVSFHIWFPTKTKASPKKVLSNCTSAEIRSKSSYEQTKPYNHAIHTPDGVKPSEGSYANLWKQRLFSCPRCYSHNVTVERILGTPHSLFKNIERLPSTSARLPWLCRVSLAAALEGRTFQKEKKTGYQVRDFKVRKGKNFSRYCLWRRNHTPLYQWPSKFYIDAQRETRSTSSFNSNNYTNSWHCCTGSSRSTEANYSCHRFQARLLAEGCSQKPSLDFSGTFSLVIRSDTIRTLLALQVLKTMRSSNST